jgi:glucose-6-phosphate dehydrogenase assembly protein OpcA
LARLMPEHPSRAIVIRFRPGEQRELSARVFAQCWMPFGQRQQICCEQIEITASDASVPDLAPVVLPLVAADLPVILWCRSPRVFHLDTFPQLESIATKLVLDSSAFADPKAVLKEMSAALAGGRSLADLSWGRLTRWREIIAQTFENRGQMAKLPRIAEVRISHSGEMPPVTAYYMAAWLIDGFGALGIRLKAGFESIGAETPGKMKRVELLSQAGEPVASIGLVEGRAAEVRVGALVVRAVLVRPTDCTLMREELSIPGSDPVFARTLSAAAELALS